MLRDAGSRATAGRLEVPQRQAPESPWKELAPHFISYPITLDGADQKVFVNADGLSDDAYIKVEILDEQFRVLPGYSKDDCAPITESGFRQPAVWGGKNTLGKQDRTDPRARELRGRTARGRPRLRDLRGQRVSRRAPRVAAGRGGRPADRWGGAAAGLQPGDRSTRCSRARTLRRRATRTLPVPGGRERLRARDGRRSGKAIATRCSSAPAATPGPPRTRTRRAACGPTRPRGSSSTISTRRCPSSPRSPRAAPAASRRSTPTRVSTT